MLSRPLSSRCRWSCLWAGILACGLHSPTAAGQENRLVKVVLEPGHIVLSGKNSHNQLLVTGFYADGSLRDLTREAKFRTDNPERVEISGSMIRALADGKARVFARAGGQETAISVQVRQSQAVPPVRFRTDVMPMLSKAGCNAGTCHGNFNGKNGFRLSLRGENPDFDFASLTRDTAGRRTNPFDPASSLVLQKPTGQLPHEGGIRFRGDSAAYAVLRRWIAGGLQPDPADAPRLERLEVLPRQRVLLHGAREQQLVGRAFFSGGEVRDVSRGAVYEPSVPIVEVSAAGLVTAAKEGEVTVVVRYLDQRVPCRLAFVPERPGFRFKEVAANNYIDRHVFAKLRTLQIPPSELCDDAAFLRRAFLDVCGILPTPAEVGRFLADRDPVKREKLVEQLLARPEYADYWALKWADLLRNEEKAVDVRGVRVFHAWIRKSIAEDRPLDRFARELLTGRGSTYEHPEANYYRTNLTPQIAAETTAQLFLGVRPARARCHNHPFDRWTQEDYHGLSAFFARVRTKIATNQRKDKLDKHEINGELIVYIEPKGEVVHPQRGGSMPPRLPGEPDLKLAPDADRLPYLANWVTSRKNPYFARVMANRLWYHLLGQGIVEPVDDFRESNPASNEPLLDALAADLAEHEFRPKHLLRRILTSRTYQLSYRPTPTNREDEANFSHVQPRLLPAEVLLDALSQVTGVPEPFKGFPKGTRAVQLPGVKGGPDMLKAFGKPDRLLACECERQSETTLNQAFQLITGESITRKVQESPVVRRLLEKKAGDREIVTELYLAALARYPQPRELELLIARLSKAPDRRKALEDFLWAILNTKEFLLRR